jgi:hypothetical protein
MRILARPNGRIAVIAAGIACIVSTALWAGGADFGDDDDHGENEGPSYFGYVKDTSGATVADAKVTVAVKDRGGVITRTDAVGAFKVPGFAAEVNPDDVQVTCEKEGYKQVRVLRRPPPPDANAKTAVETECTLQRT